MKHRMLLLVLERFADIVSIFFFLNLKYLARESNSGWV